jgi:peroxiredoxin
MKKILFLMSFALFAISIQAQFLNNLTLKGTIVNAEKKMVYFAKLSGNSMQIIDSSVVSSNNSFYFSVNIDESNFFQITNGGKQYTIIIPEKGETISLKLDARNMMQPMDIKGSPTTIQVYEMLKNFNKYDASMKSLEADYKKVIGTAEQDSVGRVLSMQYEALNQARLTYLKKEINDNPSLASLLFLDKLPIDKNLELYEKVDKVLYAKYPNNEFVKQIHAQVESKTRLRIGSEAPEINLANPDGEMVALSSLRGKVVLIDFWASWCSPCRREMPMNVKLYNKYKSKGFEIYGVSLDKQKSNWVKAIKDDGLTWIHVSDLRYWNSVAAKKYGVTGIPFTVLIDAEGKVIATGLRGDGLERELQKIFGE